ncbi:MAG: hypothetical protein V4677_13420 [Bacteroidota bacterium]
MKVKIIFGFLIAALFLVNCKKDIQPEHKPMVTHGPSNTLKKFNFKTNSKWIFKNTISNSIDTMWVRWSSGILSTEQKVSKEEVEILEYFQVRMEHTLLPAAWRDIDYDGYEAGIMASDNYGSIVMGAGFFEKNAGDSIVYNNTSWNKIENIYPTLIVNGVTYSNVYEISYHPVWYGFNKIWWSPAVGFVKLEGTNHVSNQFGSWELQSYDISLH